MKLKQAPQTILGLMFLGAGGQKLAGSDAMVDLFARFRYPLWFRMATGVIEVGGATALLGGLSRPALVPVGGLLLGATMVGAIASHLRVGDPQDRVARPVALLALVAVVTAMNAGRAVAAPVGPGNEASD